MSFISEERRNVRKIMKLLTEKLKDNPTENNWMEFLKNRQLIHEESKKTNQSILVTTNRDCLGKAGRIVCIEDRKYEIIRLHPRSDFFQSNANFQKIQECLNVHLNIMYRKFQNRILANEPAS